MFILLRLSYFEGRDIKLVRVQLGEWSKNDGGMKVPPILILKDENFNEQTIKMSVKYFDITHKVLSLLENYFKLEKISWDKLVDVADFGRVPHFSKRVYRWLVENTDYGDTVTYGGVAKALETHPRAVAVAMKRNPYPLLIPCHRVVGKNSLGGYSAGGSGINGARLKKLLLRFEREGAVSEVILFKTR